MFAPMHRREIDRGTPQRFPWTGGERSEVDLPDKRQIAILCLPRGDIAFSKNTLSPGTKTFVPFAEALSQGTNNLCQIG